MPKLLSFAIVPRGSRGIAFAAATTAALLLAATGSLQPDRPFDFAGLFVASVLISALISRRQAVDERGTMRPSFVVELMALLIFGAGPATLAAAAGALMRGRLVNPDATEPARRTLLNAIAAMVAMQIAGTAHQLLGGTPGEFVWPAQAVPIAAAVIAYSVVSGVSAQVVARLIARQPVERAWPVSVLRECPTYFIGAILAVGLVALLDARMWQVMAVAAVPLFLLGRAYSDYLGRLEHDHRRREVIDSLGDAMAVVDSSGRVTLWNDTVERFVGCRREQVLGRPLVDAVPALRDTGLAKAINETLKERTARTLSLRLPSAAGPRLLRVRLLPVSDGVTLLWDDITEAARAEQALKRTTERLALAAEGANDGLWEWDLRTGELYVSARWRALLGLPASDGTARHEDWIERVHPEDLGALNEAFRAYLAGETVHLQHEHRIRHEDGTYRWFLCRGIAAGAGRRPSRIAGSLTDTTERVAVHERLRTAGFLDPLTGLRNRADFLESLGRRLDQFKRRPADGRFAVLYLDLDRFKVVNDSLGHLVGDEVLVAVSRRLESCLRQDDCLGRLGGDEFAILLNTVGDETQANAIAFRIQKALSAPLPIAGREVFTSASIGIAFGHAQYASPDEIMRDADTAMYQAKARGKARHELFDADMHARERDRLGLENDLRHAVDANAFEVYYQPIVLLGSGMCVGFESLVRWTRNGEAVSPATFVPMAEELGLIEPLGTWVLRQACRTFADWQRRFPDAGLDYITVNASSRQLAQQHFLLEVEQALHNADLKPSQLRIEVTETALLDSPHHAAEVLAELRRSGVKIYLDDFGTGYSSLSHLHKLPVDALKIDRSFVRSLLLPDRPAIVESILALARTMHTSVVAEGIEDDVQAQELERLGCTHAQGYLFSRPLSMRAAEELIMRGKPLGPKRGLDTDPAGDAGIVRVHSSRQESVTW